MMQKLFLANWKMYGDSKKIAEWAAQFSPPPHCETILCPPFPYLSAARAALPKSVGVGAQCVFGGQKDGAHTGAVSARMLADIGCGYVLVGHSERRAAGETDADCAAQIAAAAAAGLTPVLCVGETAAEESRAEEVAARQLRALELLPDGAPCAVAYEPVWAIGSGKTPPPDALLRMRENIRRRLISHLGAFGGKIRILYGGSIKKDNADLPAAAGMDGGLVGGASLDAAAFSQICRGAAPERSIER